jgi:predicted enzyme related to lactoylglutathione lyase
MTLDNNGRFVWHDLMTTNVEGSLAFYGQLFPEWNIETVPIREHTYYKIHVDEFTFGGLVAMSETENGPRTHWIGYIDVADCDETLARCAQHGGTVIVPSFDVPDIGKFAVLSDPQGALFKPFQMQTPNPLAEKPANGHLGWDELHSNDMHASRRFYQSVFGWSAVEKQIPGAGPYTAFRIGEREIAGCLPFPEGIDAPPSWLTYIYADDVEARAEQAEALGAQTYVLPREAPGIGKFSVHADPNGAAFAIYSLV